MEIAHPAASPSLTIDERGIGWVTFDDPDRSVNLLTDAVMRRLAQVVDELRTNAESGRVRVAVFRSGKPGTFIAGADVGAIEAIEDPGVAETAIRFGQAVFMDVERLPIPSVAAIDGICVGGGLELSLACTHRVVSDSDRTRLGLPEVQLGIIPAWGGTTRLPRLIGLRAALDLLLTGKQIDARKAKRIGLAGRVLPAQVFTERVAAFAVETLELPSGASRPGRGLGARLVEDTAPGRRVVLAAARRRVLSSTGGHYPAPLRILEVLRRNLGRAVEKSLAAEARAASELIVSSVSKNLVHVFRLREAARKGTGLTDEDAVAVRVEQIGVLGAGVMGGGIAQLAANNGIRVRMKDIRHEAVVGGLRHARELFDEAVSRRRLTRREANDRMGLVSGSLDYAGFGAVDLVVEAIVENMDVKRAVLQETESKVSRDCILATNTSSLSVDVMARSLEHPERFCGLHFFNPVHRMPLVELVRGARTSDATIAAVHALAVALGKVPVVVRDGPGFLVNRILAPYLNEAGWLLSDGASIERIDAAAKEFGMPMGPLRLIDEVGIDVSTHAGAAMHAALGDRLRPPPALVALDRTKRLGRKGGLGFYRYENGKERGVDPDVYGHLGLEPAGRRGGPDARDIRRRLVSQMVNEAARALGDGIVSRAGAVDLAMVMGTGFPPFRGGLLRFADTMHTKGMLDTMQELADRHGDRFAPAPLLKELADRDRRFYDAFGG